MNVRGKKQITQSAIARTGRIVGKIEAAMKEIEADIKAYDGIYPYNAGRVSLAEVCRRAGVHKITIMGKAHCETTRPMMVSWIKMLPLVKGSVNVRKTVTARSDSAHDKYKLIACQFQAMYQLEIPRLMNEIGKLQALVANLESENNRLRELASEGSVVNISNMAKKKHGAP